MNYIDIINSVLRRMRERQVTSLYENQQSSVVAELVNDAKRYVENAHDWTALRQNIIVTTADGIGSYSLLGTGNRATIIDVRETSVGSIIRQVPAAWVRRKEVISDLVTSRPSYWSSDGVDASGDAKIKFWPTPNDTYTMDIFAVVRTPELSAEGDEVTIPVQPILLMATAMAIQERGGADSIETQSAYTLAQKSLGEHVMLDAALNPEEQIWYPQ